MDLSILKKLKLLLYCLKSFYHIYVAFSEIFVQCLCINCQSATKTNHNGFNKLNLHMHSGHSFSLESNGVVQFNSHSTQNTS